MRPLFKDRIASVKIHLLSFFCLFQLQFSCGTIPDLVPPATPDQVQNVFDELDSRYVFASALSSILSDADIRKFIKAKVMEQFDGDYNFLYIQAKDEAIGGSALSGRTLKQALSETSAEKKPIFEHFEFDPLLQIAIRGIPGAAENWDPDTYQPLVLYIPEKTDPDKAPFLPAITPSGELIEFNHKEASEMPVILIDINERIIKTPKEIVLGEKTSFYDGNVAPYFSDHQFNYFLITQLSNSNTEPNTEGSQEGQTKERQYAHFFEKELLEAFKFTTHRALINAVPWLDGKPELRFFVIWNIHSIANIDYFHKWLPMSKDRSRYKDCGFLGGCTTEWVDSGESLFHWDLNAHSETVVYHWFEVDAGRNDNFRYIYSNNVMGVNDVPQKMQITLRGIDSNDDDLGNTKVNFYDELKTVYSTGIIDFSLGIK
ncbi:hypothetical protein FKX85_04115 [Echinicola soli]|uniref:Uncharacterized protein n=1 Tax=Echinicola soli TaxID=2591634 RepID=A0A514CEJ9_9BACT|nr:hypothetical protein [Echinicola soli]QDH78265.1 hypothetical protein FKX85_04115 [Echinicola soli]